MSRALNPFACSGKYFAKWTLESAFFYHVDAAFPADVLVIAPGEDKDVSLFTAEQTSIICEYF
jgi:hypothetical protein